MDKSASLNPELFETEKSAARGLPNVHFLDMTDVLCGENFCQAVQNGAIMYRDNSHLTGEFCREPDAYPGSEAAPYFERSSLTSPRQTLLCSRE